MENFMITITERVNNLIQQACSGDVFANFELLLLAAIMFMMLATVLMMAVIALGGGKNK